MIKHLKPLSFAITVTGLLASTPALAATSFQEVVDIHSVALRDRETITPRENDIDALASMATSIQQVVENNRLILRLGEKTVTGNINRRDTSVTSFQDVINQHNDS